MLKLATATFVVATIASTVSLASNENPVSSTTPSAGTVNPHFPLPEPTNRQVMAAIKALSDQVGHQRDLLMQIAAHQDGLRQEMENRVAELKGSLQSIKGDLQSVKGGLRSLSRRLLVTCLYLVDARDYAAKAWDEEMPVLDGYGYGECKKNEVAS